MIFQPMNRSKEMILWLLCFAFVALLTSTADARGFRGGFRSFRGGSPFHLSSANGWRRSSRSYSWGGRSGSSGFSTSGRRGGSFSRRSTLFGSSNRSFSKADQALYRRAKTQGTVFSSRNAALNAFKRTNQSKFRNHFSSRPSSRPDYIPKYYKGPQGARFPLKYRPDLGGYGYYNPRLGRWSPYRVMGDALMVNLLMRNSGYYYGGSPYGYGSRWGGGASLGSLVFLGLLLFGGIRLFNIRRMF